MDNEYIKTLDIEPAAKRVKPDETHIKDGFERIKTMFGTMKFEPEMGTKVRDEISHLHKMMNTIPELQAEKAATYMLYGKELPFHDDFFVMSTKTNPHTGEITDTKSIEIYEMFQHIEPYTNSVTSLMEHRDEIAHVFACVRRWCGTVKNSSASFDGLVRLIEKTKEYDEFLHKKKSEIGKLSTKYRYGGNYHIRGLYYEGVDKLNEIAENMREELRKLRIEMGLNGNARLKPDLT